MKETDAFLQKALSVRHVRLRNFRSFRQAHFQIQERIVLLSGANGAGKTNLLEAVSLLAPGKGLRQAKNRDFQHQPPTGFIPENAASGKIFGTLQEEVAATASPWQISAKLENPFWGNFDLCTGPTGDNPEKRSFLLNGTSHIATKELSDLAAVLWLTPQTERLFGEAASGRRRFFDRLITQVDSAHAGELAAHDHLMAERSKILASSQGSGTKAYHSWLKVLEEGIAGHAVALTAARMAVTDRLNRLILGGATGAFPPLTLHLLCPIAEKLRQMPALDAEAELAALLAASRTPEAQKTLISGRSADFLMQDKQTGRQAYFSSTGQQKALLIGLILAEAALLAEHKGFWPILLLDEPLVHLDHTYREHFFTALQELPMHIWLSGTEKEEFTPIFPLIRHFTVKAE